MIRFGAWVALAALLAATQPASAQDAVAVVEPDVPAEYTALIDSAVEEFAGGRWVEARALFGRAQAMYPNARALRGVGMAAFELRDYVEACRALEGALLATRRPLSVEQRRQVEALRARALNFVGRFVLGAVSAGATLSVDGHVVPPGPTILLSIGDHELVLSEPSRAPRRISIAVRGGEADLAIDFPEGDLSAAVAPEAVVALDAPRTRPSRGDTRDESTGSAWPYAVVGVGAALTVAGAIVLGVGISDYSTVSGATAGSAEWADLESAYDRAPTLGWIGGALLGVGLASAGLGVVWAVTRGGEHADDGETWVALGLGSITVGGQF